MESSKFTPGTWLRDGRTVYALDETGNCNRFSVLLEGGWTYRAAGSMGASGDRTSDAELFANATLIAAAPDLLEALEELSSFVAVMIGRGADAVIPETVDTPLGIPIKTGDLMRETRAAIAKARGTSL